MQKHFSLATLLEKVREVLECGSLEASGWNEGGRAFLIVETKTLFGN
ncbi:MAG: hypothetical protein WBL63_11690 [Candidatus Acidiferrum sp.]